MKAICEAILKAHRNKTDTVIYSHSLTSIKAIDNKKPSRTAYINHLKFIINTRILTHKHKEANKSAPHLHSVKEPLTYHNSHWYIFLNT